MLNVPVVAPAFTVTDAGAANTGDAVFVNATTVPPGNPGCERVRVHIVLWFEVSVVSAQDKDVGVGGCSSTMLVDAVASFSVAVRLAVWFAATVPVETLNVPAVAPAGTVTVVGAASMGAALLVNATAVPPGNPCCERCTVHIVLWLEVSVVNVQDRDVGVGGGSSATLVDAVTPFTVAVKFAVWFAATVPVEILKVAVVAPATAVTDVGAASTGDALLVNATTVPPGNAGCERFTVQVVLWFEVSVVNVQVRDAGVGGGSTVTLVDAVAPFSVAVKLAVWFAATVPVEMLNVADIVPAATVTVAGTASTGDALFVNGTTVPPGNPGCERFTVHVVLWFEVSVVKMHDRDVGVGGGSKVTFTFAVPFSVAVKVAV